MRQEAHGLPAATAWSSSPCSRCCWRWPSPSTSKAFTAVVRITLETDTRRQPAASRAPTSSCAGCSSARCARSRPTARRDARHRAQAGARRPHPRRRARPAAAQDAVRREVRRPRAARARPPGRLRRGDVITQDRTSAIELQQLMNDLLPLLRTVQPAKLNAHARRSPPRWTARRRSATTSSATGRYRRDQPALPALKEDISRLADVAEIYGDAAPDLMQSCATSRHQHDPRRPAGAAAPHVHRRPQLGRGHRRLPRGQRANVISLAASPARSSASSRTTRRATPASSRASSAPPRGRRSPSAATATRR